MTFPSSSSELIADPSNPRKIGREAAQGLSRSLHEFGDLSGIVFNAATGQLVCGHQRLDQIRKRWGDLPIVDGVIRSPEGHEFRVRIVEWTDKKQRAANVAANAPTISGEFTSEIDALLASIKADVPELYSDLMLDELMQGADAGLPTDEDEAPEPPEAPVTRSGDLWLLGEHRLLCGDSTSKDDVERVMGGLKASCVFTDPPYGVSIGKKNREMRSMRRGHRNTNDIVDDDLSPTELIERLLPAFELIKSTVAADDCSIFVTCAQGGPLNLAMLSMLQRAGLPARHILIWRKNAPTFSMGRLDYDYAHEPILMTWGKKHKRPMRGSHKTSVWEIDKPRASPEHPTMKPVELYANGYLNNSDAGDVVYEPYSGSGTAIVASEQVGRKCCAIEIDPRYCDVAVKRWETLTGKKAAIG